MTASDLHIPVMRDEVLAVLEPVDGQVYLDGTFGAGGYSRAILDAADCTVWACDQDPDAIARGQEMAREYDGRLTLLHGRFGDLPHLLDTAGAPALDGAVFDLGVSSPQLDNAARGFSFRGDGPLDMRMAQEGPTAADIVNDFDERELAGLIRRLGEERHARRVAHAIVMARETAPITRTLQLAQIIRDVMPRASDGIDPATRTFMALRIHVNDELGELDRGLVAAEQLLQPGGRLVVVSFHSLEDRRVKNFLRIRSDEAPRASRHAPEAPQQRAPSFTLLHRRGLAPGEAETCANPRARSARMRAARRTAAPAWPMEDAA
ncbi:MAG: 16S rRNA (cytosine(1402)-N(4))-methyltransferase RsmH [Proteobacteria bacterium]|nr:16S rRNA (cytosine(1402)-N(4))-methyltransferase RsmH [Pseudomonadota bacterium]